MKERVIIANKFYYPRGGDCMIAMGLERILRSHGHEVAVFAMDYPENVATPWQKYFPEEVSFSGGVGAKLKAARRVMGGGDVRKKFIRLIDDFKPDVVHLHNIHSYLSPVLAEIAHQRGIRVVWTMHDFKLMCPAYSFYRDGKVCEACRENPREVIRKRCMKGSLAASMMAYMEHGAWNRLRLERCVDTFISPSHFMLAKMEEFGFTPSKLAYAVNFLDPAKMAILTEHVSEPSETEPYACYIGRVVEGKGVDVLTEVFSRLPYRLKVAGAGPLLETLKRRYGKCGNIEFLGMCDSAKVTELLQGATLSVVPSVLYDNNPLSVIESHSCGTPVIGARIGGIPELIDETNGITYPYDKPADLEAAVRRGFSREWDRGLIASRARIRYSTETHYTTLMDIYRRAGRSEE